jgi:hypothetical protein
MRWQVRAIALAEGRVLSIIDDKAVTYTRAWCMLEMNHALDLYPFAPFDIYTAHKGAAAYDMTTFDEVKAAVGKEGFRGSAWLAEVYRRMPIVTDRVAVGLTSGPCAADCGAHLSSPHAYVHVCMHEHAHATCTHMPHAHATCHMPLSTSNRLQLIIDTS